MAGTVDEVVDVDVEVVDVDVLVEVDVAGGVVVDVVVAAVDADAATATSPESSLPHAVSASRAAHATAIDCRRMRQSASENQRCNTVAAACWPDRTHAGMPMP